MPHTIRLREPWQRQRLEGGLVRFTRRFHQPTGLDQGCRVWLVVGHVKGQAEVLLNDQPLGAIESSHESKRFNITARLRPENMLVIIVSSVEEGADELLGSVCLEIE